MTAPTRSLQPLPAANTSWHANTSWCSPLFELECTPATCPLVEHEQHEQLLLQGSGLRLLTQCSDDCKDAAPPARWAFNTCDAQLEHTNNCAARRDGSRPDGICSATCGVCMPCGAGNAAPSRRAGSVSVIGERESGTKFGLALINANSPTYARDSTDVAGWKHAIGYGAAMCDRLRGTDQLVIVVFRRARLVARCGRIPSLPRLRLRRLPHHVSSALDCCSCAGFFAHPWHSRYHCELPTVYDFVTREFGPVPALPARSTTGSVRITRLTMRNSTGSATVGTRAT